MAIIPRNNKDLFSNIRKAKAKLATDLKEKHGSYYHKMMMEDGRRREGFEATTPEMSGPCFRRIKRVDSVLDLATSNRRLAASRPSSLNDQLPVQKLVIG